MDDALREILVRSRRVVFFGGAGVSTESGIPDFRSAEGLYRQESGVNYPPEEVMSRSFFLTHPEEFFAYYKTRLVHHDAQPNPAHRGLAHLESTGKLIAVVTQNIDGLHQKAGSKNVLELHGSVQRNYCVDCDKRYPLSFIIASAGVPTCESCSGIVRPDVVLYEEALDPSVWSRAVGTIAQADTLIVGGTSLAVYPAAGLLDFFAGSDLVLINKEPTPADRIATYAIQAPIGEVLGGLGELA
ncbi:MAG: NAD-dependent protein deacylase [Propionibacteriaceae bacterium]|jgi:NAD-dependent deacetylase|nr:NAD-dependent protein deacylase [Propionibacteriaceae bacterium]